ncbi:pyrimidine/purine nucleoside phosphorylase [Arcobacter sp. F2176]|uniref:pyrimidine/purine nucleoside phosphorylase n=1 Tax=unclassified Arcobacter TaxID=2593671 RepID=UPI00100AA813|nr:pyrimidine/purine nucleoside phosphorylase [Arcobacter sp. F2176]RXJ82082.1 hypothetical protein CRU95_04135 [Arcobacter sp. F2176]
MDIFKSVDLVKKANIYFDGNVTSRSFVDSDGERKSLGIMMPGTYNFGTAAAEIMEIVSGECEVKLNGSTEWKTYTSDTTFQVPANSNFDIKVKTVTDYCCSYIK